MKDFIQAGLNCLRCHRNKAEIVNDLKEFWTNTTNQNSVLPCLSVRTGLDLFLKVKAFPPGSEVITSAINIPDMVTVMRSHRLKVQLILKLTVLTDLIQAILHVRGLFGNY